MPIEIKELIIRAAVDDSGGRGRERGDTTEDRDQQRQQMIAECVEQVVEILKRKTER